MADVESLRRILNPCLLHLQKLQLELKCAFCLDFFKQPVLLPCNHMFCSSCIPSIERLGLGCTVCKSSYLYQDLRPIQHIENIICIYRSMHATFFSNLSPTENQANLSDDGNCIGEQKTPCVNNGNLGHAKLSMPSFPANKRVHASFCLTANEASSPRKSIKSTKKTVSRGNIDYLCTAGLNSTHDGEKEIFADEANPSMPPFLWSNDHSCHNAGHKERKSELQTMPDSSPSFDQNRNSDNDSNNQRSEKCAKKSPIKAATKKEPTYDTAQEECGLVPSSPKSDSSIDKPKVQSYITHFDMNVNPAAICAFCQSSEETEASGHMLHCVNGIAVLEDEAMQSNVLHAHKRCIEWAPQVYFVGETAMNLEAEVARGKKIKCSVCAKRGAALGCSAKTCRRSFHVPCAAEIPECLWDEDNFLLFCPVHASLKLRNRRSKPTKKIKAKQSFVNQPASPRTVESNPSSIAQECDKYWMAPPDVTRGWVLCGSALSSAEKDLVAQFASLTGAVVTKDWRPNVTHVIASIDDRGSCSRTLKFLMAILSGKWILNIDWVKACMEEKYPVNEEPYEISCDVHGCIGGPKNGRIRILENAPKLFSGLNFYFFGDFVPSYKGYLKELALAAGGAISLKVDMDLQDPKEKPVTNIVIFNKDAPLVSQNCGESQLSSLIEKRHEEAQSFAAKTSSHVVDHTWLLESIAACKLQPLVS